MTRTVASLSTIPPRFAQIGATLTTLLNQSFKPDRIEVWIPRTYRRFPAHAFCLPDVPEGVTIEVTDDDLGPATKILPCARKYRGTDTRILYVDDDRLYWTHCLNTLLAAANKKSGAAVAAVGCDVGFFLRKERPGQRPNQPRVNRRRGGLRHLAHNMPYWCARTLAFSQHRGEQWMIWSPDCGYADIAEGFGGVLVRPEMFDDAAFAIPPVLWAVDDLWLSGCLARQGIPIWVEKIVAKGDPEKNATRNGEIADLGSAVIDGHDRLQANRAAIRHFRDTHGIWP